MYPVVHSPPRVEQTFARPLPQQPLRQSMTREPFQSPQSSARSMPPPRQIASPMVQPSAPRQIASPMAQPSARTAPQFAYNQQPRAEIQMAANHGQARDAGRGEANRTTMNSNPAHERGQR